MSGVKLMAHMVAGYPGMDESLAVARALVDGGADYLEVQFPFSDPSADGPVIERASHQALAGGFTTRAGFDLLRRISDMSKTPLFIMTYASLVFTPGVEKFVADSAAAGVCGLIIPDLPPDYDEGLYRICERHGVMAVPVLSPAITDARLEMIAGLEPKFVYTALRAGVTGKATRFDASTVSYLEKVARLGARIVAGFGVRSREQMSALAGKVHAAAVGSYFLEEMNKSTDPLETVRKACAELKGAPMEEKQLTENRE